MAVTRSASGAANAKKLSKKRQGSGIEPKKAIILANKGIPFLG